MKLPICTTQPKHYNNKNHNVEQYKKKVRKYLHNIKYNTINNIKRENEKEIFS